MLNFNSIKTIGKSMSSLSGYDHHRNIMRKRSSLNDGYDLGHLYCNKCGVMYAKCNSDVVCPKCGTPNGYHVSCNEAISIINEIRLLTIPQYAMAA